VDTSDKLLQFFGKVLILPSINSVVAGDRMNEKSDTLVFIDEIQAYDHLLTLLKFLKEDDKFTFIASGSLLGVTLSIKSSNPLGSIQLKHIHPLDFEEFLVVNGN